MVSAEQKCPDCYGSGYFRGFGGPCPRRCEPKPLRDIIRRRSFLRSGDDVSANDEPDPNDPTTWYLPEHAHREVGENMTVRELADRIFAKRRHIQRVSVESKVCAEYGVTWRTVNWQQMLPAIQADIFELCYWLRFDPMPHQAEVLQAVMDGELRLAVKSGQGPGKTATSATIGLWWGLQDLDVRTIVTAPSMKQCKDVWLSEVAKWHAKAHPLLRKFIKVTRSRVYFGGFKRGAARHPNWRCELITASTSEAFQGQHNKRLNAIVEEASGVAPEIIEALKGTVSNYNNPWEPDAAQGSILMIGNPNTRESEFFRCFEDETSRWRKITIDAEAAPNVNPRKIIEHALDYGVDSPFYFVRVLGLFPDSDPCGIIRESDLRECVLRGTADERKVRINEALSHPALRNQRQFGIDLARQGGDETVVYQRRGGLVVKPKIFVGHSQFEPAHAIRWCFAQQIHSEWYDHQTLYVFDAGGMGQGVMHLFQEARKEYVPFHTQAKPTKPDFANKMSEAWFQLRRLTNERKIVLPDDPILFQQLTARHYELTKDGKILVEPKDKYMKRTGNPSPDRADALVMCFYQSGYTDTQIAKKSHRRDSSGRM